MDVIVELSFEVASLIFWRLLLVSSLKRGDSFLANNLLHFRDQYYYGNLVAISMI